MTKADDIAKVIRRRFLLDAKKLRGKRCCVALSGGVDSCAVLAALLEVDADVFVVSYSPATHVSTDYNMARRTARNYDLEFHRAIVPMDAEFLEAQARYIMSLGYSSKVQVESLAPMVTIAEVAAENGAQVLLTGDQSDGYFSLSKTTAMAVRNDTEPSGIDAIRMAYYERDKSCSGAVARIAREEGMEACFPFRDVQILEAFLGTIWREVNKPRIKEPVRLAWADYFEKDKIWVRNVQVNLHKGDSGFGNTMGELLMDQPHLQGKWVSPIGLYKAMARGEV